MFSIQIAVLLLRGLAFISGVLLIIIALYTYRKQQGLIQKKLKCTWARLHKKKRRWDRFTFMIESSLDYIAQNIKEVFTVNFTKPQLFMLLVQFVITNIACTAYFTSAYLHNTTEGLLVEVLLFCTVNIVVGVFYLRLLSKHAYLRSFFLAVIVFAQIHLLAPYYSQIDPYMRGFMFVAGMLFMPLLYVALFCMLTYKVWKDRIRFPILIVIIAVFTYCMFSNVSPRTIFISVMANGRFDVDLEVYPFYDAVHRIYWIVFTFYPLLCVLIMFLFVILSILSYLCWLSVTATVRSAFEHAVIKRRKFLISLGIMLVYYAVPNNSFFDKMKEVLDTLFG